MLSRAAGLANRSRDFLDPALSHAHNCEIYVRDYILAKLEGSLLLAIDEADRLLERQRGEADGEGGFKADFFRMLRIWHQNRDNDEEWKRLDMVLVTSTEPYLLIPDGNTSPFNVSEAFLYIPEDFSPKEVSSLNDSYQHPFASIEGLYRLLRGNPSLTQQAFFLVKTQRYTEARLMEEATSDTGPFSSHLRYYMLRLQAVPEILSAYCRLVRYKEQPDFSERYRLLGAGLIREENGQAVPRCNLYASFFKERLTC